MDEKLKKILRSRRFFIKTLKRRRRVQNRIKAFRRAHQGMPKVLVSQIKRRQLSREFNAPETFSLLKNPHGVIKFLNLIEANRGSKHPAFVHLVDIKEIDHAAIVVLLAILLKYKRDGIPFNGNFPKNARLRRFFSESKFLQHVNEAKYTKPTYIENADHQIVTHSEKRWDPALIQSCRRDVSAFIWGRSIVMPGLFRILTEVTHNTLIHASQKREGVKDWWLSVNRTEGKRVTFSFYDDGIGIIASLRNKRPGQRWSDWKFHFRQIFKRDPKDIQLRDLLEGDIHKVIHRSRTGDKFRGKGLPAIMGALEKGQIGRLHLITDNRYADVGGGVYYDLPVSLKGTLYYWEIDENNRR